MDFLTICQRVNNVVGFQGNVTSVDATGYQQVLTQAVKDAYQDIQRYRTDWDFQKRSRSVNVSDAKREYTIAELFYPDTADLEIWEYINYDHRRLSFLPYELYQLIDFDEKNGGKPQFWSLEPASNNLLVGKLDKVYTLNINYIRTLDVLVSNSSVPIIPERHHQLIVYMAIMKLATFVGNLTLYDTYSQKVAIELPQLMREQNPAKRVQKRPIA